MDTDWQETLQEVGKSINAAERAKDHEVKIGNLNDACRGLLGVVQQLASEALPHKPDPDIGMQ